MNNKEAIAVLKSNYPHGRVMLSEAVDLSIKTLEAAESQTTAVQQLKAKIAIIADSVEDYTTTGADAGTIACIVRDLRQLSAV